MILDPHSLQRVAFALEQEATAAIGRAQALDREDRARVPHLALYTTCLAASGSLNAIAIALQQRPAATAEQESEAA